MRRIWFKQLTALALLLVLGSSARSATVGEIRLRIDDHNAEIKKLETQIDAYQKELRTISETSQNLQSEIARLETTRKKLAADIEVTERQIAKTDLTIGQLTFEIGDQNQTLDRRRAAVGESLRQWHLLQNQSLVEIVIGYDQLSNVWTEISALAAFQRNLERDIDSVSKLKTELETTRSATADERTRLASLKERLADQRQIAKENQAEKDRLLNQTKNQESNYKKLLADTIARKEAFAKELFELESQLRLFIDLSKLPSPGQGVLKWPLEKIFITQQFGKTVDAKRLYASGTHNGIDLRASIGTSVLAAAAGRVKGVGDTDLACRGVSYGQWVLIEHANGLSTIYAHLSLIKTVANQMVATGEVIGYSGQSGYSTGPHLHLSVVATQGVRIDDYNFRSCAGTNVTMPLVDTQAYLDPLLYL